jgi:acyl transferase domain-containing protein
LAERPDADDHATAASLAGSAMRQDGMSASLTAPNGTAQTALVLLAMSRAASDPATSASLGVESHGTGTPLGDPTEVRALEHALPPSTSPRVLGGVKANMGHLEPVAGIAGLVKLLSALLAGTAAPNAQLRVLNPHVVAPSIGAGLALPAAACRLPHAALGSPSGGTSSFGYSGTIGHAVLTAATPPAHLTAISAVALYRRRACPWTPPERALPAASATALPSAYVPFLGRAVPSDAPDTMLWEQQFASHEFDFLTNHRCARHSHSHCHARLRLRLAPSTVPHRR